MTSHSKLFHPHRLLKRFSRAIDAENSRKKRLPGVAASNEPPQKSGRISGWTVPRLTRFKHDVLPQRYPFRPAMEFALCRN